MRAASALLAVVFGVCPVLHASQPSASPPAQAAQTPTWRNDLVSLRDPATPVETRGSICRRLVCSPEREAIDAFAAAMASEQFQLDLQGVILREIGLLPRAPEAFLAPIEAWLRQATPDRHAAFYRAISSIRTRAAAKLLLSYATPSATTENREAVYQALARLTGRNDLGSDRQAWTRWLAGVESLSDKQWEDLLLSNLALRADTVRAQRDEALRRLVESERARYLAAQDVKARSSLLAAMLRDDFSTIRRLGIELINRELANAREVAPEVGTAALKLLADPSPEVRSAGADLIDRLLPLGAPVVIREALARERDPNVLAKLLSLARRYPDVAPPELLMGWLGVDSAVRRAVIDAMGAMQAAGLLGGSIDMDRALSTLRSEKPEELSVEGLKLLCELGNETDRRSVAGMLTAPSADARLRAAQALVPFPEHVDAIVAAARNDPTLFAVAASALKRHRPTLEGYRSLLTLPAPNPLAFRESVNAFSQGLSLSDLKEAASLMTDVEVREAMLARAIDLTALSSETGSDNPFTGDSGKTLCDTLLLLARTQVELIKPAAALGTLDLLPDDVDPALTRPLRLKSLLYLDRIDEALFVGGEMDEWLDALEYCVTLPQALSIVNEIELRFSAPAEAQRARLQKLKEEARKPRASRNSSSSR